MKDKIAMALAMLSFYPSSATSQSLSMAGDLFEMCSEPVGSWQSNVCISYALGAIDGTINGLVMAQKAEISPYCINGVSNESVIAAFKDRMRSGAGNVDNPSAFEITIALHERFPCP